MRCHKNYLLLFICLFYLACENKSNSSTRGETASSAGEIALAEQAGTDMAPDEQPAGQMSREDQVAGEVTSEEQENDEPEVLLGEFELWQSPIERYIAEASEALGPDIDRSIHDLFVFNNRLHLGYGDANLNAGGVSPIQLLSFDSPEAELTVDTLETGEEGIYRYRLIDGELMIAGTDSTDADELTSRPLIEGNFLRTRNGQWEKYRSIQGGEHVHDATRFMEGLWAVGSGADNRMEWDNFGVYRYLWFSDDGGVTWRKYKRILREEPGDTRFVHLLAVGPRLFIFGYLNPSQGPTTPANEMILGLTGEPTPLNIGLEDGQSTEDIHPLANVFIENTYPINESLGVISGFDIDERKWRVWTIDSDGLVTKLSIFGENRLVDFSVNNSDGSITALFNTDNESQASQMIIMYGASLDTLNEKRTLDFESDQRPVSITQWGDAIYLGRNDGQIWRAHFQEPQDE